MERRDKIALTLNIVVFLMALVGSILCFGEIYIVNTKPIEHGIKLLKFFTLQSNILAGVSALLYVVFFLRERKTERKTPFFVYMLRYIATIDLILTFLVVALFLGFIVEEGYFSLYVNANFFFHFAIPIINFINYIGVERKPLLKLKHTFVGLIHVLLYAIFYIAVVIAHFSDGAVAIEYDWYAFAQKGLPIAFVCAFVVLGVSYLTAFGLYKGVNKKQTKKQQKNLS
ncbi:MAG: hypothetical protein IJS68_03840 [Clostridia bacterium]|nr:hypothetical protein [Clostridia bacterium]